MVEQEPLQNSTKIVQVLFETTGCRLNQIESESAARFFLDKGFKVSLVPLTAKNVQDTEVKIAVINTCAVTQKAEQKDRRIIRLVLEKAPCATVIVTGCYAQLSYNDIKAMDLRIAVLKGQQKSRLSQIPDLLQKELDKGNFNPVDFANQIQTLVFDKETEKKLTSEDAFKLATDSFLAHSRSSIKIQDGCNNRCTYCTINKARGYSVSLAPQEVIDRVKKLEEAGQSEVVITTVNIGQYSGEYNGKQIKFAQLLDILLQNTSKINFRISSLYPEVVDDYFCSVIKNPRVRPHFHLSVQSGSNSVLKNMARRYTSEDVLEACRKLKIAKENPFLACDIITGFPGETEADFEDTMKLCKECGFAWVHIFPFSARPGTPAYDMKPKIPQSVSGERAKKLGNWAKQNKKEYIDSCKDKIFDAVLETVKHSSLFVEGKGTVVYHAVTENFLHCQLEALAGKYNLKSGQAIRVKILGQVPQGIQKGGEIDCQAEVIQ